MLQTKIWKVRQDSEEYQIFVVFFKSAKQSYPITNMSNGIAVISNRIGTV